MSNFLTREQMDELSKLATEKLLNIRFNQDKTLAVLKYSKRAFWEKAWEAHPILAETRGMIVEWATGRIVAMPFTKVFNYGETPETESMFRMDEEVICVEKINGFLGIAVWDNAKQEPIIISSGTFDSEFADMAREYLDNDSTRELLRTMHDYTFMFEICHPKDPHIIKEASGAYLIGARKTELGSELVSEYVLDSMFNIFLLKPWTQHYRPLWSKEKFGTVVANRKILDGEGSMVRGIGADGSTDGRCLKIKSTHYLTLKFIARSKKVDAIWDDPNNFLKTIDEDFHEIVKSLPSLISKEDWYALDEQKKLEILKKAL